MPKHRTADRYGRARYANLYIVLKENMILTFPLQNSGITPCLILAAANAYNLWSEHWEHWEHLPALEERVEYPYQNIRTKNFPWGDGDKTLFWNDSVNYHDKDKTT
jgi:hypothetical protein